MNWLPVTSSTNEMCVTLSIADNDCKENNRSYQLTLGALRYNHQPVLLYPTTLTITVIDNDGK